jgi:hypothetical protein
MNTMDGTQSKLFEIQSKLQAIESFIYAKVDTMLDDIGLNQDEDGFDASDVRKILSFQEIGETLIAYKESTGVNPIANHEMTDEQKAGLHDHVVRLVYAKSKTSNAKAKR